MCYLCCVFFYSDRYSVQCNICASTLWPSLFWPEVDTSCASCVSFGCFLLSPFLRMNFTQTKKQTPCASHQHWNLILVYAQTDLSFLFTQKCTKRLPLLYVQLPSLIVVLRAHHIERERNIERRRIMNAAPTSNSNSSNEREECVPWIGGDFLQKRFVLSLFHMLFTTYADSWRLHTTFFCIALCKDSRFYISNFLYTFGA